jgi:hypothetical protein
MFGSEHRRAPGDRAIARHDRCVHASDRPRSSRIDFPTCLSAPRPGASLCVTIKALDPPLEYLRRPNWPADFGAPASQDPSGFVEAGVSLPWTAGISGWLQTLDGLITSLVAD